MEKGAKIAEERLFLIYHVTIIILLDLEVISRILTDTIKRDYGIYLYQSNVQMWITECIFYAMERVQWEINLIRRVPGMEVFGLDNE